METRINKHIYYLNIAEQVAARATCLRRKYGAVIVNNDGIKSTGYNGAPRGRKNCTDVGICKRENLKIQPGQRYELCRSVHAETNACLSVSREDTIGGTLYLVGIDYKTKKIIDAMPCSMCKRNIIQMGIERVIVRIADNSIHDVAYKAINVEDWINEDDYSNINID